MSFPPHLPAWIYDFAAGARAAFGSFFHRMVKKAAELGAFVRLVAGRLTERLSPGKRRLVFMALAGFFAVFLLIFAGIPLLTGGKPEERKAGAAENVPVRQGGIPPDELFLPDEPDFVPGVILEREQRAMWTAADAAPLWQDPLKNGEEPWRNLIEKAIDEIMESVP